ncbi:hypothetical protein LAZ40_03325 [Cereibacter sphaeroides]|uniref:hypothetical protein n=1 Tax=Cereibacter sphaeroides TaxID=1063 RepID=UPI001F386B83|nr:hypothetical protein [Cereibacter sphaeroides]MCE6958087.1 hypothetical protein [Cereibacter sphaeroides]MCE6971426.1 hypothetical protein [Cereibacter sphaeroides]
MDFLDLFDIVAKQTILQPRKYIRPQSCATGFTEDAIGLDSLDRVMTLTLLGEIYAVPPDVLDRAPRIDTIGDLKALLEREGLRIPGTVEEARNYLQ